MINILITGESSYVGLNFTRWLSQWPDKYKIETISLRNNEWQLKDFSRYDVLLNVTAIVHKKEEIKLEELYKKVNRDIAVEVANKAKSEGVKQLIFMSSLSVYGLEGEIDREVNITENTPCNPITLYGKSKLEAEYELNKLNDNLFKVVIVRAPMIYGPNCPGNYAKLRKLALTLPVFPNIFNKRSMIYIDNLSEFFKLAIENQVAGIFFPQNNDYVNTTELVQLISRFNSKKIHLSKCIAIFIKLFGVKVSVFNKMFGSLTIAKHLSTDKQLDYCVADLHQSIENSEIK
ncbi:NAD-dependent epimerase/dehydratase family protein [Paenibacillus prosopidis]|uniref:UDP-glucose 4-epimerase n=1 Tax=Paenibacillus prosopidis TaxID=630520 RepID=A0A368VZP0_9BACL|nr:NAD-dependent epimerase/dehydratase family protein [Paenibacillus prosopidis]RCW47889.1 UDP-glucose 4-epimerase [Paenibacillus prosopidis]